MNKKISSIVCAALLTAATSIAGQVWVKPENVPAINNAKEFLNSITNIDSKVSPYIIRTKLSTIYEYAKQQPSTNEVGKVSWDRYVSHDRSYEPPAEVWTILEKDAESSHQKQVELKHLKKHERFWKFNMNIQECIYWLVDATPYVGYEPWTNADPTEIKKRILDLSKNALLEYHITTKTPISSEILEQEFTSIRDALDAPCCEGIEDLFKKFGIEFDYDLTETREQMKQLETEYKLKTLNGSTQCKNRLMIILGLTDYNEFVHQLSK